MDPILRQCYKGIAYCYFNPDDIVKKKSLDTFISLAWKLGYPRTYFDIPSKEIKVEDMTEWEIKYVLDKT